MKWLRPLPCRSMIEIAPPRSRVVRSSSLRTRERSKSRPTSRGVVR